MWELLTSYIYLPRLRNRRVLQQCIEEGVVTGAFGYARDYNPDTGEYRGLRYEGPLHDPALGMVINENSGGLLVAPGRAAEEKRKALEREQQDSPDSPNTGGYRAGPTPDGPDGPPDPPDRPPLLRRIVASKTASGDLSLDDFNNLRSEIIRNLRDGGGEVTVTITIEARKDDGFDETAEVARNMGSDAESVERLARVLYNHYDRIRDSRHAVLFNTLVTSWAQIQTEMSAPPQGQMELR